MILDHHIKGGAGGASIRGMRPEMAIAFVIITGIFDRFDCKARVSSGTEGKHKRASSHYRGEAIDISKLYIPSSAYAAIGVAMKQSLGDDFDVIEESTHWHIQFKPKVPMLLSHT